MIGLLIRNLAVVLTVAVGGLGEIALLLRGVI